MLLTTTLLFVSHLLVAGAPGAAAVPAVGIGNPMAAPVVAGRVVTELEKPLPGVVVTIQGTPQATSTNATGEFLLPLSETKSVLVFKCQGYRDQLVPVVGGNSLTVKMYSVAANAPAESAAAAANAGQSKVLNFAEELPTFPGGESAYRAFVRQTAHYPQEALDKGFSGTVFVSFVVDEQGRITDAEVAKGCGHGLDQEALRVIRLMPWWNPGRMAGKPVRVSRVLAVPFVFRQPD
ncbi:TonB family protein [Hymenobacter rubidus]|uniref:TonB family protein n=1 Tax=Hymenobacter rubidus TaxID=1441626 RepID=UPI00191CFAC1|nr:TonB family protein [Hymenobacter rubidus]